MEGYSVIPVTQEIDLKPSGQNDTYTIMNKSFWVNLRQVEGTL